MESLKKKIELTENYFKKNMAKSSPNVKPDKTLNMLMCFLVTVVCVICTRVYVLVRVHAYAGQRLALVVFLYHISPYFLRRSHTKLRIYQFSKTDYPKSCRDPPVSIILVLGV